MTAYPFAGALERIDVKESRKMKTHDSLVSKECWNENVSHSRRQF